MAQFPFCQIVCTAFPCHWRVSTANTFEKFFFAAQISDCHVHHGLVHGWVMDLIDSGPALLVCSLLPQCELGPGRTAISAAVTCAEVPIYTHVAQAPGKPTDMEAILGRYLTRPFARFSETRKKRTCFLLRKLEGATRGIQDLKSHRYIRICQLLAPCEVFWDPRSVYIHQLPHEIQHGGRYIRMCCNSALILREINGYGYFDVDSSGSTRWNDYSGFPLPTYSAETGV